MCRECGDKKKGISTLKINKTYYTVNAHVLSSINNAQHVCCSYPDRSSPVNNVCGHVVSIMLSDWSMVAHFVFTFDIEAASVD